MFRTVIGQRPESGAKAFWIGGGYLAKRCHQAANRTACSRANRLDPNHAPLSIPIDGDEVVRPGCLGPDSVRINGEVEGRSAVRYFDSKILHAVDDKALAAVKPRAQRCPQPHGLSELLRPFICSSRSTIDDAGKATVRCS